MIACRAMFFTTLLALLATPAFADNVSLPQHERVELENGTVLLLSEKHDVPLIGLAAFVRGGAITDPDGLNGLSGLLADVMNHGAGERDAATFAEAVAAVGGELSITAGLEGLTISADFMARDAELMIELVADVLQRPTLDADEFEKLRDRSINLIKATKGSSPGDLLPDYGNAFLFGPHPYGNPVGGSEASLQEIAHEDLLRYYEEFVGSDRLIISVVGDYNIAAMKARLTSAFGEWRPAAAPLPVLSAAPRISGRRVLLVDAPGATQTYFWIGSLGVERGYEQRAELDIANTLFGGRFTSLLVDEMRTKAGLTYGVRSVLMRPSQPGSVAIVSYTKTDSTVVAMDLALELLARLRNEGFDDALVASGKNYILGQFPPRLETAAQLANQFAALQAAGLDETYINDYGDAIAGAARVADDHRAIGQVIRQRLVKQLGRRQRLGAGTDIDRPLLVLAVAPGVAVHSVDEVGAVDVAIGSTDVVLLTGEIGLDAQTVVGAAVAGR